MNHVTAIANSLYMTAMLLFLFLMVYAACVVDLNATVGEVPPELPPEADTLILRPIE